MCQAAAQVIRPDARGRALDDDPSTGGVSFRPLSAADAGGASSPGPALGDDGGPMVQLLDASGRRRPDEHFDFPDVDVLPNWLRDMVLARRFDSEATALQRHGELALWPPCLGQEAAQVGAARALGDRDVAFPSYREHAVVLTLGLPYRQLLALFRGCDGGAWEGLDRVRNYQMIIGAQTLHATGYAMGMQLDAADSPPDAATLVFHGDGATSQGDVNEAYLFAASRNAPVVFLCQNNQWAISEPVTLQSRTSLHRRADGFGFPGIRVDGNDVLAVHAVTTWALERARRGEGPALIEAYTYRMGAHTTSDDPTKYRTDDESRAWADRDPIDRLATYLKAEDLIDDAWLAGLDAEARDFGADVRAAVADLRDATMASLFDNVYTEITDELRAQRREHEGELA